MIRGSPPAHKEPAVLDDEDADTDAGVRGNHSMRIADADSVPSIDLDKRRYDSLLLLSSLRCEKGGWTLHYLFAARPVMGLFAAMLCLASFRLRTGMHPHWIYAAYFLSFIVLILCSATMLWNDAWDVERDLLKGKRFGSANRDRLFWISKRMFVSAGFLIGATGWMSQGFMWILILICFLALYYVRSYHRVLLPTGMVALCSALPATFALFAPGDGGEERCVALFLLTFLAIAGREILKDIEDMAGDAGWKETLPVRAGEDAARKAGAALIALSAVVLWIGWKDTPLVWVVLPFSFSAILVWPLRASVGSCKLSVDATTVLLLAGILSGLSGP